MIADREAAKKALGKFADDATDEELIEDGFIGTESSEKHLYTIFWDAFDGQYETQHKSLMNACAAIWSKVGLEKGSIKNPAYDRGLFVPVVYKGETKTINGPNGVFIVSRAGAEFITDGKMGIRKYYGDLNAVEVNECEV
jgi:hypothetical protein